MSDED
jgi:Ca2+-binding EF-hand superfamily protein